MVNIVTTDEEFRSYLRNVSSQISYSGADIRIQARVKESEKNPNGYATLADIQTLSYSTHRETYPVRALGHVAPKGITKGARTVAGSIIFTVFDRQVLSQILPNQLVENSRETGVLSYYGEDSYWEQGNATLGTVLVDQLPPLDISILFANEYGSISQMAILGVSFVTEGQVMSIQDMIIENTVSYLAQEMIPMRPVSNLFGDVLKEGEEGIQRVANVFRTLDYMYQEWESGFLTTSTYLDMVNQQLAVNGASFYHGSSAAAGNSGSSLLTNFSDPITQSILKQSRNPFI